MTSALVVDTSVLVQAFVEDRYTTQARAMLLEAFNEQTDLHILEFGLVECVNIFWKRVMFHGLQLSKAKVAVSNLQSTPLVIHSSDDYFLQALDIGVENHLPIYDSLYIVLADRLNLQLITDDVKQSSIAAKVGIALKPITDFAG